MNAHKTLKKKVNFQWAYAKRYYKAIIQEDMKGAAALVVMGMKC